MKTTHILAEAALVAEIGTPLDEILKAPLDRPRCVLADPPTQVRCPLCRHPLVARMMRTGPGFPCACAREPGAHC